MSNITQKDVEEYSKKIKSEVVNILEFLKDNCKILLKKQVNTRQERIFLKNIEQNNLLYQSPEAINLFIDTVCFYMALEKLGIPYEQW